jgi:hypothetical protein
MSFLSSLFGEAKTAVEEMIPANLQAALGPNFAKALVANFAHDAKAAAAAGVAAAKSMSAPLIATVWTTIEQEAGSLASEVLSGKVPFDTALASALTNLKSEAVATIVPGLAAIGKTSLETAARSALSMAVSSLAGNPTSTSA